jgi:hypothetical protein
MVMSATQPRYSKEEFARRGDAIYERDVQGQHRPRVDHAEPFIPTPWDPENQTM